MKYGSRQSQNARQVAADGAKGKHSPVDTGRPSAGNQGQPEVRSTGPRYSPEPESRAPITPDMFAQMDVVDEWSLGQRLLQLGADLYCAGEFASFKDRLRRVILSGYQSAICGRDPTGKVETVGQAFERVTGEPLAQKSTSTKPHTEAKERRSGEVAARVAGEGENAAISASGCVRPEVPDTS